MPDCLQPNDQGHQPPFTVDLWELGRFSHTLAVFDSLVVAAAYASRECKRRRYDRAYGVTINDGRNREL